jgi:WD40 repeat protein
LQPLFALAPAARLTTDFASESNDRLVSVGYDTAIVRWSLITGQEIGRIGDGLEEASADCLAIAADQSRLATCGTYDQWGIHLWDMATGKRSEIGDPGTRAGALAFNPEGSLLASGSNDNEVWIWDVASRQAVTSFAGDVPQRIQAFHDLLWLSDQVLIAAGSDVTYWWDVATGELLERLDRPEEAAFFVDFSFSQNADQLAAAAQDENVYVWSRDAGAWAIWPGNPDLSFSRVEFSPDGRLLAATSYQGGLWLWSVEAQELAVTLDMDGGTAVRFSPDGRYMATGGWEWPIWLWGIP